jgi:hypothetical protein
MCQRELSGSVPRRGRRGTHAVLFLFPLGCRSWPSWLEEKTGPRSGELWEWMTESSALLLVGEVESAEDAPSWLSLKEDEGLDACVSMVDVTGALSEVIDASRGRGGGKSTVRVRNAVVLGGWERWAEEKTKRAWSWRYRDGGRCWCSSTS